MFHPFFNILLMPISSDSFHPYSIHVSNSTPDSDPDLNNENQEKV